MSAQPYNPNHMTEAEYLEFEDKSASRHEYVNGEVIAMTGATVRHNTIANNISSSLTVQLAQKDCIVNASETRIKVDAKISYRYPDVVVVCGKIEFLENRRDTITNPTVIIEVLSPSTEIIDRNQKLEEYTQLPSVEEYVLVSQDKQKIERFLRQDNGDWLYSKAFGDDIMFLPSIDCKLDLNSVYAKLDLLDDEPAE